MSINIPYSDIDFEAVIEAGISELQKKREEDSKATRDNLRGGNSGCLIGGDVYGCHRAAIGRALGIDMVVDKSTRLFFDAGAGIEEVLRPYLEAGWALADGNVKAEEEIPVKWNLKDLKKSDDEEEIDRDVTGRPDFVLLEGDKCKLGVELKTIVSENGAHSRWFDKKPDPKHLAQSLHYMWQHNTPWVLTYVCPIRVSVNHWKRKEYGLPFNSKIDPFRIHFYLTIKDGRLYYKCLDTGEDVRTELTVEGVQQYYQLVDECIRTKSLFLHPASKNADGSPLPYRHEKYCDYCKCADKAKGDWDLWQDYLHDLNEQRGKK